MSLWPGTEPPAESDLLRVPAPLSGDLLHLCDQLYVPRDDTSNRERLLERVVRMCHYSY